MSPAVKAATLAHYRAQADEAMAERAAERQALLARAAELQQARDDAYNAELVARVQAEADAAIALPWWFWEAAVVVFVLTIAISTIWPWGVAS